MQVEEQFWLPSTVFVPELKHIFPNNRTYPSFLLSAGMQIQVSSLGKLEKLWLASVCAGSPYEHLINSLKRILTEISSVNPPFSYQSIHVMPLSPFINRQVLSNTLQEFGFVLLYGTHHTVLLYQDTLLLYLCCISVKIPTAQYYHIFSEVKHAHQLTSWNQHGCTKMGHVVY